VISLIYDIVEKF